MFATNLLAIEVAAGAVFVVAGLVPRPVTDGQTVIVLGRRFAVPILLLIPITAFLLNTLVALVRDDRLAKHCARRWTRICGRSAVLTRQS